MSFFQWVGGFECESACAFHLQEGSDEFAAFAVCRVMLLFEGEGIGVVAFRFIDGAAHDFLFIGGLVEGFMLYDVLCRVQVGSQGEFGCDLVLGSEIEAFFVAVVSALSAEGVAIEGMEMGWVVVDETRDGCFFPKASHDASQCCHALVL